MKKLCLLIFACIVVLPNLPLRSVGQGIDKGLYRALIKASERMSPANCDFKGHGIFEGKSESSAAYEKQVLIRRHEAGFGPAVTKSQSVAGRKSESSREWFIDGDNMVEYLAKDDGLITVRGLNRDYGFLLEWNRSDDRSGLRVFFRRGEDIEAEQIADQELGTLFSNLPGTSSFMGFSLRDLIHCQDFAPTRVQSILVGETECVRVDFSHAESSLESGKLPCGLPVMADGYFVCNPSLEWAVIECGFTQFNKGEPLLSRKSIYTHTILESGRPTLAEAIHTTTFIGDPKAHEVLTCRMKVDTGFSSDVFRLTHYGLVEPEVSWFSGGAWVWYLVIGTGVIFGGVMIRRWFK